MEEDITYVDFGPNKDAPTAPEQDSPQPEVGDVTLTNKAEVTVPGKGAKGPEASTPEADTRPENAEQKPPRRGCPPKSKGWQRPGRVTRPRKAAWPRIRQPRPRVCLPRPPSARKRTATAMKSSRAIVDARQ